MFSISLFLEGKFKMRRQTILEKHLLIMQYVTYLVPPKQNKIQSEL